MKLLFRLVINGFGYGFVLNHYIDLCLEFTYQKREIYLLLRNSLDLLYPNMANTVFILMEVLGILKPVRY